jgi:uncharacterized protein involved in exopolysaccharide biosynthesis
MTTSVGRDDGAISLFAFGAALVRNRWRIARWIVGVGALTALTVINAPRLYKGSVSFVPQAAPDAGRSGLASLAGQFGVSMATGDPSSSPDFYVKLVESRVLLLPIIHDTIAVSELGGRRMSVMDLIGVGPGDPRAREDDAMDRMRAIVNAGVSKPTGVVEVSVTTKWPSASLAMTRAILDGINTFNERRRQSQAGGERRFAEERMKVAREELRAAEDAFEAFMRSNVDIGRSPSLALQRDRIQREVGQKQAVVTTLSQAYEEARLREVRDTPVITVFEEPWVPTTAEPRGRIKRAALGMILGAVIGVLLAFVSMYSERLRHDNDPDAGDFLRAVGEMNKDLFGRFRRKAPAAASP